MCSESIFHEYTSRKIKNAYSNYNAAILHTLVAVTADT
jgi:hypothetical protein